MNFEGKRKGNLYIQNYYLHTKYIYKSACCRLPSLMVCIFCINLTFSQFCFCHILRLCFWTPNRKKTRSFYSLFVSFHILFFCTQICICMLLFRLFIFSLVSILRIKESKNTHRTSLFKAAAGSWKIAWIQSKPFPLSFVFHVGNCRWWCVLEESSDLFGK